MYQHSGNTRRGLRVLLFVLVSSATFSVNAGVLFVHTDHLGTPVAYTNAKGEVVGEEATTPYGESLNPPTSDNLPSYTGHVRDGATGLVYMQARYYDPVVGRFLSTDPVTFDSGKTEHFNRYWYANGNPIKFLDPTGKCSEQHSDSELACDLEDAITEVLEEAIEEYMEEAGVEPVPEGQRDPEGEFDHQAEDNSVLEELAVIVVAGAKSRIDGGGVRRKPGSLGKPKGRDALRRENKQARDAGKAAGLSKDQQSELHDRISGENLSYQEIVEVAQDIKSGR